ncbi:hypothetical protein AHiyo4_21070 [Arthrobacter sp. Hiyo4]|nr:hypothetical protein AHiyo4_21070 [Arthrobacter sp. Hiyo4]
MATDIEGGVARIEAALNTPTLKLLDRKSAVIAMPLLSAVFPDDSQPVPVEQLHTRIEALLDELRTGGYTVPSTGGKASPCSGSVSGGCTGTQGAGRKPTSSPATPGRLWTM